jgi:catechol 2,3-dioxygenase-like lactoylglutathione lyase family enzyme
MKRIHIHVGVENIDRAVRFYSALFGAPPIKTKPDYARWMLDDPRVNFAVSTRAAQGVDHLGIQVDENDELTDIRERVRAARLGVFDEGETVCCYAKSEKSWVEDPSGVPWEAYRTMEEAEVFSRKAGACCAAPPSPEACCESDKAPGCCR